MASNDYEKKLNVDYETDEVPVHAVRGIDINVDEMLKNPYDVGAGENSRRPDGGLTLG